MKILTPLHRSLFLGAALLATTSLNAAVIYEDNFSGAAGSIVNTTTPSLSRKPNLVNTLDSSYQGSNTQPSTNGSGQAYSTNGGGGISLLLPEISSGDVITITLQMTTVMTSASGWLMTGFTSAASTFGASGQLSTGLSGNGRFRAGTGTSSSNLALTSTNDSAVTSSTVGSTTTYTSALTTYVMTYNTASGLLNVSFSNASMGSPYTWSTTTMATVADLNYFTIQWNGGGTSTIDYMKLEVVPEPGTVALFALGAGGVVFLSRRKRPAC